MFPWPRSDISCWISLIRCNWRVLRAIEIVWCDYLSRSFNWPVILISSFWVNYRTALCFQFWAPFWRGWLPLIAPFYFFVAILLGVTCLWISVLLFKLLFQCMLSVDDCSLTRCGLFSFSISYLFWLFLLSTIIIIIIQKGKYNKSFHYLFS